jgi:hypothetical protein
MPSSAPLPFEHHRIDAGLALDGIVVVAGIPDEGCRFRHP